CGGFGLVVKLGPSQALHCLLPCNSYMIGIDKSTHHHIVQRAHTIKGLYNLICPYKPFPAQGIGLPARDILSIKYDFPGCRNLKSGNQTEKGGLPRSIWSDQTMNGVLLH